MGNRDSALSTIANNLQRTTNTADDTKQPESAERVSSNPKAPAKKKDITLTDDTSFDEKVLFGLQDIDEHDQLSVIGYFRQIVANQYSMDIPAPLINYVIIYLHFVDERELYIGNLHELHQEAMKSNSRNRHVWTMFISTSKTALVAPKTIAKVTYILHPTFHPPQTDVSFSPFFLRRIGWGTFDVEAEIVFKDKYNRKSCWAVHGLDFQNHAAITKINLHQDVRIDPWGAANYVEPHRKEYAFATPDEYPNMEK